MTLRLIEAQSNSAEKWALLGVSDAVTTESTDEATIATIDGTNIQGLTDDYVFEIEIGLVSLGNQAAYASVARAWGFIRRVDASMSATLLPGAFQTVGTGGATDIAVDVSSTNFVVKFTPGSAVTTVTRCFVRLSGLTTPI